MATVSINLYNFDLPENQSSQYILTSPRSLQACRQLDVRPIDLLPKSEDQLSEERPHLTSRQLKLSIQRYEGFRLRNLKAARVVRESIVKKHLSKGTYSSTDSEFTKNGRESKNEISKRRDTEPRTTGNEANLNNQSSTATASVDSNLGTFEEAEESLPKDKSYESSESLSNSLEEEGEKYEAQVSGTKIDKKVKEQNNKSIQIAKSENIEKYETESSEKEMHYKNNLMEDSKSHFGSRLTNATPRVTNTTHKESNFTNISRQRLASRSRNVRPSSAQKKQRTRRTESPFVHTLSSSTSKVCSVFLLPKKKSFEEIKQQPSMTKKPTKGNFTQKSCFWESARVRKPNEGTPTDRGSFLLRPSNTGKRVSINESRISRVENDKENGNISGSGSSDLPTQNRERITVPEHKKHCLFTRPLSTCTRGRPRNRRNSSGSDSSSPRRLSPFITRDKGNGAPEPQQERGRTPIRKSLKFSSKSRSAKRQSIRKKILNQNLSKSVDALESLPSRASSPSTASLPTKISPRQGIVVPRKSRHIQNRPTSATSDSSLSSISSLNSISTFSELQKRKRYRNPRLKLQPSFPRPTSSISSRPTSSLAIPTYLQNSGSKENYVPKKPVRSNSAKLPKSNSYLLNVPSSTALYRSTSNVSLADSQILSKFLTGMDRNVEVTPHDKRILELLALKHEKRYSEEVKASRTRHQWLEDREREIRETAQRWQEWRNQINEKRFLENAENERRLKVLEEAYHQSQENLSSLLRGKDKRAQEMLQTQQQLRLRKMEEKRLTEAARKAVITAARHAKEERQERQRQKLLIMWEKQQRLVEQRRREREEIHRGRLGETSSESRERHEARHQQVQAEGAVLLEAMKRCMEERLSKADDNVRSIQQSKENSLRRTKDERDRKAYAVKALHDQLETDLLKWRQHVLQNQLQMSRDAEARFLNHLQTKSTTTQEKLSSRQEHHRKIYEQIKEREKAEEAMVRQTLATKDFRTEQVTKVKEWRVQRAKTAAITTANLRDDLRQRFCPETFDRKAARALVESRIENLRHTRHPLAANSHIVIG